LRFCKTNKQKRAALTTVYTAECN